MIDAPTTRLDIMSPATAADPWPLLCDLREQGPVVWHEGYRRWLITTDREVRKVVIDFQHFTVEGTSVAALFGADAFISIDDRHRHNALRGIWNDAFRKQGLDRLEPIIRDIVYRLLDTVVARLQDGETVDLSTTFCRPLPTMVIARMMGVPDEMLGDVVRWSDAMASGGPAYGTAVQSIEAREAAKTALADYLGAELAARRGRAGDDLITMMANAEAAKDYADAQLVQNVRQLLFAGNETTAKWLAQLFVTYGEHRGVQREIVADRALVPAANDELMRWQGPVGTLVRKVRGGPITIAGIELADGDDVTCVLASANRDPARYDDPDRFDIHRAPQPNLGFGVGFHGCLGLALAKLEGELAVNAMLDCLPCFTVAEGYSYSPLPLRGPMPVIVGA